MKTLIQVTGVRYACEQDNILAVMAALEEQKPEVLLVTEHTHDFGIIVRALIGTQYRGVVSRFDLEHVLAMMRHDSTSVLVGQLEETSPEGLCYTVGITGDYPTPDIPNDTPACVWTDWNWTGAPLMDVSPDDRRLDISLKVALAELRNAGRMNKQTLLEHLDIVMRLARWDVSKETQEQLSELRRLVGQHADNDIRALAPQLRHTLTALGSKKRGREFADTYWPELLRSSEAEQMRRLWSNLHKAELSDIKEWQPAITRQLDAIDDALMSLPADLCYQKDHFESLMHRLLYLDIPRRKLLMLLSALVLRQLLRNWLGLSEDDTTNSDREDERRLIVRLAPIFYGNTDSVREFLLLAKGKKNLDIIFLTNLWIRDKRICSDHCHRPLWTALHDAGIYTATESNWNSLLNVRRNRC
ncbi:MAG: hypothetical protein J6W03_02515 [Bacteroidaceae bacterium]|nr:hypothetical protein [Bacteroidaceae bacterium]